MAGLQCVWLYSSEASVHPDDGQVTLVPSHILQFPQGNVVRQRTYFTKAVQTSKVAALVLSCSIAELPVKRFSLLLFLCYLSLGLKQLLALQAESNK